MAHVSAAFDQIKFQGRDDDVALNSATFNGGGGLNGNWTQDTGVNFRVRFEVNETAGGAINNRTYQVFFKLNSGPWTLISGTTAMQWAATGQYADLDATTQVLGSATFLTADGFDDSNGPTRGVTFVGNESTELEICLNIDSVQVDDTDTINLRVYMNGSVLDAYAQEPAITVNDLGGALVRVHDEVENIAEGVIDVLSLGGGAALVEVHDETEEIAEGTIAQIGILKVENDTAEISEGTPQRMSMVRVEDEIEEISEGVPQRMSMVRIEDEVEEISEDTLRPRIMVRVEDEVEEIAEGVPQRMAMVRVSDDDVDISEDILSLLGLLIVQIVDEDVDISEGVLEFKAILQFLDETVNLAENVNRARVMVRVLDETEQITETFPRLMSIVRLLNESGDITEDTIATLAMVRILDETENITEATLALKGLIRIIDEVENIAEDVVDVLVGSGALVKLINEAGNLTEDIVRTRTMVRILSEVENLIEGAPLAGLGFAVVLDEIGTITESLLEKTDTMPFSVIAGASPTHGVIDVMRDVIVNKAEQIVVGDEEQPELEPETPSEPLWERFFPAKIDLIVNYGPPYTDVDLPRIQNDANVPDGISFLYDDREAGSSLRFDLNAQQNALFATNDDRMVVYVSGQQRTTGVPALASFAWRFNGSPTWGSGQIAVPVGGPAPPFSTFVFDETVGFFFGLGMGVSLDITKIDFLIGISPQGANPQKRNFDIDSFSMWLKIVPPPEPVVEPIWESETRELGTGFEAIVTRTTLYKDQSVKGSTWAGKPKTKTPWEDK